jgi:CDGSH-type Zn-finger protein
MVGDALHFRVTGSCIMHVVSCRAVITNTAGEAAMATIKVLQNGPYLVQGDDVTAIDWNGVAYPVPKRPFALCRCGGSTTKPFCDGTHSKTGFKAAEAAVPGSQDKPATNP